MARIIRFMITCIMILKATDLNPNKYQQKVYIDDERSKY